MIEMTTTACRHCSLPIGWVRTVNGNALPVDPVPNPAGNVFVGYDKGRLVGVVVSKDNPNPSGVCYMPHFSTCKVLNAANRRTPKRPPRSPKSPRPEPTSLFDQGDTDD